MIDARVISFFRIGIHAGIYVLKDSRKKSSAVAGDPAFCQLKNSLNPEIKTSAYPTSILC
jgi:hypothetical protein